MNQCVARMAAIATYVPETILSNAMLAELYPEWSEEKIFEKTGIRERRIAGPGETAGDLAFNAAQRLFEESDVSPADIDFIILCTQAPDHLLPTTACILQERLGVGRHAGAFDINLGCSGFVYGLSVAKGLIESGSASRVLLLTADTYSKYIHPQDKSVRTLFGDAGAATLISAHRRIEGSREPIGPFIFGTDGRGAQNLIVPAGMFRISHSSETAREYRDESGNVRTQNHLYMNGADVMAFSLREVPRTMNALLAKARIDKSDVDMFVLHQANRFMLDALRKKLGVMQDRLPVLVENCGNTVSSTIPMALATLLKEGRITEGSLVALVGFGVGYSWAGCLAQF